MEGSCSFISQVMISQTACVQHFSTPCFSPPLLFTFCCLFKDDFFTYIYLNLQSAQAPINIFLCILFFSLFCQIIFVFFILSILCLHPPSSFLSWFFDHLTFIYFYTQTTFYSAVSTAAAQVRGHLTYLSSYPYCTFISKY